MLEGAKAKACPYCDNEGFTVVENVHTGEPEQEQCQFCYEEPNSLFMLQSGEGAIKPDFERFANRMLHILHSGYNVDGSDIQEIGIECSLLIPVERTASCGAMCACACVEEFPLICYKKTY